MGICYLPRECIQHSAQRTTCLVMVMGLHQTSAAGSAILPKLLNVAGLLCFLDLAAADNLLPPLALEGYRDLQLVAPTLSLGDIS